MGLLLPGTLKGSRVMGSKSGRLLRATPAGQVAAATSHQNTSDNHDFPIRTVMEIVHNRPIATQTPEAELWPCELKDHGAVCADGLYEETGGVR